MSAEQYYNLFLASISVLLLIVIVSLLKIYGNIPAGLLGPKFNLLTYGYLCNTGLNAIAGKDYWVRYDLSWPIAYKPLILLVIVILNIFFMAYNFKLEYEIKRYDELLGFKALWRKLLSNFIGFISLFIFLTLKTVWE